MIASVNLSFPSFASRHNSSKLGSALDLASVATPMRNEHRSATATRYDSVACDERNFSSSEERALAPLTLVSPRSAAFSPLGLSPQRSDCRPTAQNLPREKTGRPTRKNGYALEEKWVYPLWKMGRLNFGEQ